MPSPDHPHALRSGTSVFKNITSLLFTRKVKPIHLTSCLDTPVLKYLMLMNDQLNTALTSLRLTLLQFNVTTRDQASNESRQDTPETCRIDLKKQMGRDQILTLRKLFNQVRDELTVSEADDLILKGTRIVIPSELHQRALALAHGHQGIVKTKQLLGEKIWFPKIDQEVEKLLDGCLACQANGPNTKLDPLQMSPLPPTPWHTVHIDFCGPFPTEEYLLVVIDAYSRFPEVDIIHSTSAKGTISKLDHIFATHGVSVIIRSDNGPPFTSSEFKSYMSELGINHQRITPLWPQANSEAEILMKPLIKTIRTARTEQKDWKKELYTFLLNYRATPHSMTRYPPSELLFNRSI